MKNRHDLIRVFVPIFAVSGLITLIYASWQFNEAINGNSAPKHDSAVRCALVDTGRHLTKNIERVTLPALLRGRKLANDPEIIAAIDLLDHEEMTRVCNNSIRSSTEIDAVAFFNLNGDIVAINTVYADGSPIPDERVDRIKSTSFSGREIIQGCLDNNTSEEMLEFQTSCDITPAFFDSSGLSVAHSVPVYSEDGNRIGVVSTRLRFSRINDLIESRNIANGEGSVHFVTDNGGFFDETLNSKMNNVEAPIPTADLKLITQPLAVGEATEVTIERQGLFHALFRMNNLTTIDGGGIQTLISVPNHWFAQEARAESALAVTVPTGIGLLMLLVGIALRFSLESNHQALIASKTLSEHEALRGVIECHSIVSESDALGRITRINENLSRISGYSNEELVGQDYRILNSKTHSRGHWENVWRTLLSGNSWRGEICNRTKDGSSYWVDTIISPFLGSDGKIDKLISISSDITDRKQAEKELSRATLLLERTGELAQVGGWSVDLTTMKLSWTQETFRISEIDPPNEPDLESGINLFAPEARPVVSSAVQAAIDHGTPYDLEVPLITAKGQHRWVKTQGYAEIQDGKPVRIFGTFQDITDRKKVEDKLAASERRLRTIIEAEPECVKVLDTNNKVVEINAAGLEMLQADSAEQVRAYGLNKFVLPKYHEAFEALHANVRAGTSGTLTFEIEGLKGRKRWMDTHAVPLRDELGNVTSVLGVTKDITDLKTTEAQLVSAREQAETANLAKSAFLANMSHEIRTPLTAILGFTEQLMEEEEENISPEHRQQVVNLVRTAGNHLLTIINDILDISKIEADMMTIELIETPLPDILSEVESLIQPRASEKCLLLTTSIATPLPEQIICDPTRLRQILMNLAGNAIKFTEQGSCTITASSVDQDGDMNLIIDVEDTGPGLTEEQRTRLFQAFGQADETVTRRHGGNGLGLTISRRLAKLMGGDVNLVHSEPGKGSCFRLTLPLKSAPGSEMVSNLEQSNRSLLRSIPTPRLTGRILLAEDGVDNQRLICYHLQKAGAIVDIADNGMIALEMINKADASGTPYDLLLTDMQMPKMDGYTLARTLRQLGNTISIVALTAHAMADDRTKCLGAGCDDYAAKPINKTELLTICAKWMGNADIQSSNSDAA